MPLNPEAGGTERITSLVAKGLSQKGHTCLGILVFNGVTMSMTYNDAPVKDLYSFLKKNNVDVVINQIAYATWLLERFLSQGGNRWHQEGGKIISCLHFDSRPASDLEYFRSLRNKSIVHHLIIAKLKLFNSFYRQKRERMYHEIYNWIYDNSDVYVTLSEKHFPYFKYVTKRSEYDKLRAINNPLTFDEIADPSVLDEKEKLVLVCSRMDEYQKRISLVLKAWKRIQDLPESSGWKLQILGTGPDLDRYLQMAKDMKLRDVIFSGRKSPETYYRKASIFLMTSMGIEGWGLTLTESLQMGVVPVVMNTCPVYSEIITHCSNGYLTRKSNLFDFENHIRLLMSDATRLRAMQYNALKSASRFVKDVIIDQWENILL